MGSTSDDGTMAREFDNIRFLIQQQLRVVDDLERRGLDGRAARDLLDRLMRRHDQLWRDGAARQVA